MVALSYEIVELSILLIAISMVAMAIGCAVIVPVTMIWLARRPPNVNVTLTTSDPPEDADDYGSLR